MRLARKVGLAGLVMLTFSCKKELPIVASTVTTSAVTNIQPTSATAGGEVTFEGNDVVTERGVVWSKSPSPTVELTTIKKSEVGLGTFSVTISGLSTSTKYYVRAYAINGFGVAYGNEVNFTTKPPLVILPTVETTAATSITLTTAKTGGFVGSAGNGTITSRGVVWSTSMNPTTSLGTKTSNGTGTGLFTSDLTNLEYGTKYYVRAYATNSAGTGYGNQVSFTTKTLNDLSLGFNGNSEIVTIPHNSVLNLGNYFTIEAWVLVQEGKSDVSLISKINNGFQYHIELIGGRLHFYLGNGGGYEVLNSPDAFPRGVWVHIAAIRNNTSMEIWEGGLKRASKTIPATATPTGTGDLLLGNRTDCCSERTLYGRIDELRIWNTALTQTSLDNNMFTTLTGNETSLVAYYPFQSDANENVGNSGKTDILDFSPTGNNGTLSNFSLSGYWSNWTSNVPLTAPTYQLGSDFQGGTIVYLDGNGKHGIILNKTDLGTPQWGCSGSTLNVSATGFGSGWQNTIDIINACGSPGIPAKLCYDLVSGGYGDWYLPSKDELHYLYQLNSGYFVSGAYWSSSEYDADNVWTENLVTGQVLPYYKIATFHTIALRNF